MVGEGDKDDDLVVVETEDEKLPEAVTEPNDKPDAKSDAKSDDKGKAKEKVDTEEDDDDEDDGDDRLATSQDDSDDDIISKTTTAEKRKKRRAAQRAARERAERERIELIERNRRLEERLARLEQTSVTHTTATIDTRIEAAKAQLSKAEQVMSRAIASGEGEDAALALRIRDEARDTLNKLETAKRAVVNRNEQAPEARQRAVQENATKWARANSSWYDPTGGNDASRIATRIDAEMLSSGLYDPAEPEYWRELTRRVNAAFQAADDDNDDDGDDDIDDRTARRTGKTKDAGGSGPPVGSGKSGAMSGKPKSNEVYVTPERKRAMQEAGVWDDPVLRQRYLKSYQDFDRNASR